MNYEELMEDILVARDKMIHHGVEPRTIVLSPRAFNLLNQGPTRVELFGMHITVGELQPGYHFIVGEGVKDTEN